MNNFLIPASIISVSHDQMDNLSSDRGLAGMWDGSIPRIFTCHEEDPYQLLGSLLATGSARFPTELLGLFCRTYKIDADLGQSDTPQLASHKHLAANLKKAFYLRPAV